MKISLFIFLEFIVLRSFCQPEHRNWYFGTNAAITFSTNPPTSIAGSQMITSEGSASLSDNNGNLLFYSNGNIVWSRNHTVMPNGTGLNGSITCTQSALFIPFPGNDSLYYIFTPPDEFTNTAFSYSLIDLKLNNTYGDIINKNTPLFSPSTEKVTAVRHANGRDIWVIGHSFNNADFYAYLITPAGINPTPVISTAGSVHGGNNDNKLGVMKASFCGDKIAIVVYSKFAELFDFDNSTGVISNALYLGYYGPFNPWGLYGAEFSSDGTKLYLTQTKPAMIVQYDLSAGSPSSIFASADTIFYMPLQFIGDLQRGPDDKIYTSRFSTGSGGGFLGCITSPNNLGSLCNYLDVYVNIISGYTSFCLPNFMSPGCERTTGLNEILSDNISIYPNPFDDELQISFSDFSDAETIVTIINIAGQVVYSENLNSETTNLIIDLKNISQGIYFVKINNDKYNLVGKVVKR